MRFLTPPVKYFLKVFLVAGLGFAGLMSISTFSSDQVFDLRTFLFHFFFFGAAMAVFDLSAQLATIGKKKEAGYTEDNFSVTQQGLVAYVGDLQDIVNAIKHEWKYRNIQITGDNSAITMNASISWQSWGEKITISRHSETEVLIVVKNVLPTTLIDYGKNRKHIINLKKLIDKLSTDYHLA